MSEDHGNQADIGIRFVAITPDVQHVGTPLFVDRMFRIASETAGTNTPGGSVAPCSIRVGRARTIHSPHSTMTCHVACDDRSCLSRPVVPGSARSDTVTVASYFTVVSDSVESGLKTRGLEPIT
jgi:hypothetical protein